MQLPTYLRLRLSLTDQMTWAMVAFLKRLPTLTPAEYQAMEKQLGKAQD